mgnify:CR=1 FL=1
MLKYSGDKRRVRRSPQQQQQQHQQQRHPEKTSRRKRWLFTFVISSLVLAGVVVVQQTLKLEGPPRDYYYYWRPSWESSSSLLLAWNKDADTTAATALTRDYIQLHHTDQAILGLTDWEQHSLQTLIAPNATLSAIDQGCQPPSHVSRACCLGGFSAGGLVNASLRFRCASSFSQWESLKASVVDFYHNNPFVAYADSKKKNTPCDVCQIVELARRYQLKMTFLGDSMQGQVYGGISCELQRRSYRADEDYVEHQEGGWPGHDKFRDFQGSATLRVRSPLWLPGDPDVTLHFHRIYRIPVASDRSKAMLRSILETSDVLILGFGLHWNYLPIGGGKKEDYGSDILELIRQARDTNQDALVLHRENSAQHFDIPGGDFSEYWEQRFSRRPKCKPFMANAPFTSYWRDQFLQAAARQAGYQIIPVGPNMAAAAALSPSGTDTTTTNKELLVLPFHNFTALHHTFHPVWDHGHGDCTHYCGSPFMYMTLWRSLRLAMDRRFGGT